MLQGKGGDLESGKENQSAVRRSRALALNYFLPLLFFSPLTFANGNPTDLEPAEAKWHVAGFKEEIFFKYVNESKCTGSAQLFYSCAQALSILANEADDDWVLVPDSARQNAKDFPQTRFLRVSQVEEKDLIYREDLSLSAAIERKKGIKAAFEALYQKSPKKKLWQDYSVLYSNVIAQVQEEKKAYAWAKALNMGYFPYSTRDGKTNISVSPSDDLDGISNSLNMKIKEYVGLGVRVSGFYDGVGFPISPVPRADEKFFFQPNDVVTHVDGVSVFSKLDPIKVFNLMLGKPGTTVKVTLKRRGEQLTLDVPRTGVSAKSFYDLDEIVEGSKFKVVRIHKFDRSTEFSLYLALSEILEEEDELYNGLVIDLRNNPGGNFYQLRKSLSLFLPTQEIAHSRDFETLEKSGVVSTNSHNAIFHKSKVPVVVLIDGYSASASEFFSGVIQMAGIGIIMGQQSFGKGSIQSPTSDHHGLPQIFTLNMTEKVYYFANGFSPQGQGVTPDIKVGLFPGLEEASFEREADRHPDFKIPKLANKWGNTPYPHMAELKFCYADNKRGMHLYEKYENFEYQIASAFHALECMNQINEKRVASH